MLHDGVYANLESVSDVFTIGINHAVTLIAEKMAGGKSRFARAKATVLKDLGEHPDGGKIEVLDGRYGPYVKYGKVNATVPKGKDPADLTVEEAVHLIAERQSKAPAKKTRSTNASKTSKVKANGAGSEKKPAAKKTAAKKTLAKKVVKKTTAKKAAAKKTSRAKTATDAD